MYEGLAAAEVGFVGSVGGPWYVGEAVRLEEVHVSRRLVVDG